MSRKQRKNRMGLISYLIWLLNILCALLLLLSYLSTYINPEISTFFAFLGLAYLYILILNAVFVLFWLIRGKAKLFLSLIVILIGYTSLTNHIQLFPGKEAPDDKGVKILTYNVQNMVHSNLGIQSADNRNRIIHFIAEEKADITCLQEFSNRTGDRDVVFNEIREQTSYTYCYVEDYYPRKTKPIDALVMLSRFPAVNRGSLSLNNGHSSFGQFVDLLIDGDTIRVYNLHLASIKFHHEDYQFVEDISKGQTEQGDLRRGSSNIIRKLNRAFQSRAKQTLVVENSLAECPYPVIICGDFNDTPLSFCYRRISDGLQDAFVKAGHGLGNTFSGNLPPIRIDYILFTPVFNAFDFKVYDINLSDHYPVSVWLKRKG